MPRDKPAPPCTFLCGVNSRNKGRIMSAPRTELESTLHRLSNYVECQLSDIIRELITESRMGAVHGIAWTGSRFIENLREVRDGKEGDDE
jgi:hypothetical protein